MKRAVEAAKLDCVVALEEAVKVKKMVSAVMVMYAPQASVPCVPKVLKLFKGFRLSAVHPVDELRVQRFAPACSDRLNLKRLVKDVVLRCDDVNEVPKALDRVVCSVKVEVKSACAFVNKGSGFPKPAHKLLQCFDVLAVGKYRAYKLHAVFSTSWHPSAVFLFLCRNAAVAHDLVVPAVRKVYFV